MNRFAPYTTEYAMGEFSAHGELQMMQKLSNYGLHTIFDVGCNIGEWSRMTRRWHPRATIHLFEMVHDTYHKMINNNVLDVNMRPNSFGLSNCMHEIQFKYVPDNDRVSTVVTDLHHDGGVLRSGILVSGQQYCNMAGVDTIDFLKLDTEGHEFNVLQGFGEQLTNSKIRIIQFEYGLTCVLTKNLLIDFYKLLMDKYVIGRLTKNGVVFKDYHLTDETFDGPDYVAVLKTCPDIISAIRA